MEPVEFFDLSVEPRISVAFVADDGMLGKQGMAPNLMLAPRVKVTAHAGEVAIGFFYAEFSQRWFS